MFMTNHTFIDINWLLFFKNNLLKTGIKEDLGNNHHPSIKFTQFMNKLYM